MAYLANDFTGRQIADQPHLARETKPAPHRAADLSRDAKGHPGGVRDEDGLDPSPVRQLEYYLHSTIMRMVDMPHRKCRDDELRGELLTEAER